MPGCRCVGGCTLKGPEATAIAKLLKKLQDTLKKGTELVQEHKRLVEMVEFDWEVLLQCQSDELAKVHEKASERKADKLAKKAPPPLKGAVAAARKAHFYMQSAYYPYLQAHSGFIPPVRPMFTGVRVIGPSHNYGELGNLA